MTKNKKRLAIVTGIIMLAFTAISFAIPFEQNFNFWLAYIFGALAILAQYFLVDYAFQDNTSLLSKFYGVPIARISLIYLLVQLALSLLTMATAAYVPVWVPCLLFILVVAAAAMGTIAADVAREEVAAVENTNITKTGLMVDLQAQVAALAAKAEGQDNKKAVKALAEAFRYSDPVSNSKTEAAEAKLQLKLQELEGFLGEEHTQQLLSLCKEIEILLQERNGLCKLGKRQAV